MNKLFRKIAILTSALLTSIGMQAEDQLLAFPGAEGFGRFATGGRGGEIYHVTNLEDSGTGSLRDAVSQSGRIVVFDVSGVIRLKSALVFKGNNTVLGQTAPGEGIQVYGDRVSFSGANNLVVRYIRFRMGSSGTSGADACGVANGENMIFDHLSVLWGRDENFSVSWDNKNIRPRNITIQNSIIGQGLQSHSCGGLIQTIGGVTLYRNLYIENKTRNVKAKGLNQFVNNVVYNWGDGGCYIMSDSEGDSWADIENNYFMRGPWNGAVEPFTRGIATFKFYGNGNYYDNNKDGVLNGYLLPMEEQIGVNSGTAPYSTPFESLAALNANIDEFNAANAYTEDHTDYIKNLPVISNMMTAEEAYAWMIESAGPSLPVRDEVDQYLIDEILSYGKSGTKNGITSETQLPHKGTGTLSGGVKAADADGDGIPDTWETANGLNPNDPSDASAIASNGYSNIENYANSLTGPVAPYIKKPIKFAASEISKNSVKLEWQLNANTENGFEIELTDVSSGVLTIVKANASQTELLVNDLAPRTSYQIRMCAVSADGSIKSDYTDTINIETIDDPTVPAVCVNPFPANGAKEGVAAGLTFSWESPKTYGGNVLFTLLIGESAENLSVLASNLKVASYTTDQLEANKTYYWRVDAKNDIGETQGDVWSFSTTAGGVLFYTDFHTQPDAWVEKYGNITENTNIVNSANTSVTVAGMTIGCGENAIRILNMPGTYSSELDKDYGPATEEDAGATPYSIQFNTTKAGGYMILPQVEGPCVLTLWLGNPDKSQKTVKLLTTTASGETSEQSLVLGAAKRIYKHTITYTRSGNVTFMLDANAKKMDVNDVLIEKWIPSEGEQPIELTAGKLDNPDISYADGSLILTFNQEIKYNGGVTVKGQHQWENFSLGASGNKLNISYECLDVLSEYVLSLSAGAITDVTGEQNFEGDIRLVTCDFPRAKESGDNHYGKAAVNLPLNFAPFDVMAPFETEGQLVQSKYEDYPHWVQVSTGADIPGEITSDYVRITTKNDKMMSHFAEASKVLALSIEPEDNVTAVIKIQESRNCDITPGWRTIRILTEADLPFTQEVPLNAESRFVKISAPTISGAIKVTSMCISDATGFLGEDFNGIEGVLTDKETDGPAYNVLGMKVDDTYRGLIIKNGKKYIRK